jgi:hypothetical protein
MPLTKITTSDPTRHTWADLGQVVHAEYIPGDAFRQAVLAITLALGQAVRLTDPGQIAETCKALGITLPTGLISP